MLIGYRRVSTEDQAKEGVSLAAQEDQIRAYCQAHRLGEVEIVSDEGVSGTVPPDNRPGMREALRRLDAGEACGLVAVRLDRWSRNALDMLTIAARAKDNGWALHSVADHLDTTTPMGMFVLTILAGVAELERNLISARTKDALAYKTRQGAKLGNAPYGYRKVMGEDCKMTALTPDETEQCVIRDIRAMVAAGTSQQVIAQRLSACGVPTRNGGPWHRRTIQSILSQREA